MRISDWSSDVCSSDLPLSGRPRPESQPDLCGGRGRALYLCSSRFDELDIGIAIEERCVFESDSYVNPGVDGVSHKLRHIDVQSGDHDRRAWHLRLQECPIGIERVEIGRAHV